VDHKTKFWAAHVAALKVAAIDASEYARRHDLAVKSLYYWRRKLKVATQAHQTDIKAISPVHDNKFVALYFAAPRQTNCTLQLSSGHRLEMSTLPSPDWLADFYAQTNSRRGHSDASGL